MRRVTASSERRGGASEFEHLPIRNGWRVSRYLGVQIETSKTKKSILLLYDPFPLKGSFSKIAPPSRELH